MMIMIDYKLAKELKDAGFPIRGGRYHIFEKDKRIWPTPTLSELIEACPREIKASDVFKADFTLSSDGDVWLAGYYLVEDWTQFEEGKTPEEAVSRLWLALNKK